MGKLTGETLPRPADLNNRADPNVLYARSYLLIRLLVGIIGIVLPFIFIIGEALFLRGGVQVRGSLSAYYHSSMRDMFVAALCVTGFLLATYLAGQSNPDFWFSFLAGVAVLGVVFFPTQRPHLLPGAPRCGTTPMPEGCSPIQQWLGETTVASIHFTCAAVFILSLAWICVLFARREKKYKNNAGMATILYSCGGIILLAVVLVIVGGFVKFTIFTLTPLYVGEVVSVWAFGASWLLKSRDLLAALRRPRPAAPTVARSHADRV